MIPDLLDINGEQIYYVESVTREQADSIIFLCSCQFQQNRGFDPVIEKFVNEIMALSTVGIDGGFPIVGKCKLYASLCQVTCDNLALNSLFGFINSDTL